MDNSRPMRSSTNRLNRVTSSSRYRSMSRLFSVAYQKLVQSTVGSTEWYVIGVRDNQDKRDLTSVSTIR